MNSNRRRDGRVRSGRRRHNRSLLRRAGDAWDAFTGRVAAAVSGHGHSHGQARPHQHRGAAGILSSAGAYLLFVVVAAAPLPFGSVDPRATAFWCIALAAALLPLAVTAARDLRGGHLAVLGGVFALALVYAVVLHEQMAETPWFAAPHPLWATASQALGTPLVPSVSITRGEPFAALGPTLANMLALICGLLVGVEDRRARQLLAVIGWSAGAYALYGILSFVIEPTMILWRDKRFYLGSLTGTFVNRNTAAAYFGSGAIVWLCLMFSLVRRRLPEGPATWALVRTRVLARPPRRLVVAFSAFFICLTAMFLTVSRAGIVLSLLAMALAFLLYFRRDLPPGRGRWFALAGSLVVVLLLLQLFGGRVGTRFESQGLADEGRLETYLSTLRMIADHPWFGTGLGTFPWSFQAYRSAEISMNGLWDIAHNTPLELAAELGIPAALAVGLGWVGLLMVLLAAVHPDRRGRVLPLAALAMASLALLHSCIDFTLQIPGYSIVLFALVGAAIASALRRRDADRINLA